MPNAIQDPLDRLSSIIEGEKSPFVELSERMRTTSKDVRDLNLSISNLAIALEKRAGVKPKEKEKEPELKRSMGDRVEDFTKGFFGDFLGETITKSFTAIKDSVTSKAEMPAQIEKVKDITDDLELDNKKPEANLERQNTSDINLPESSSDQNKILSDMVEVLIDMRDDKSQKQLLHEALAIRKLISEQSNKSQFSAGGIEPNVDAEKQDDREKLAEAIARKLGEVFEELGIGSNSGLGIPDLPDKRNNKGNKPGKPGSKMPSGVGNAARLAGRLAGGAGLAYGAYEASEFLAEIDYGESMNEGQGKLAEEAFKNKNTDFSHLEISPQQANDILNQPDTPGKQRDIESFGGEEKLRQIAGLKPLEPPTVEPAKPFEQSSLRKYDYVPEVNPKQTDMSISKMLNDVSDQNTELKMFNMGQGENAQMLAPIISNKTINNTEQTMIAASPNPHSNASAFTKWQLKRSNYTDN